MGKDYEQFIGTGGPNFLAEKGLDSRGLNNITKRFLDSLPLPKISKNYPDTLLKDSIVYSLRIKKPLILVSTVCPSYSADADGVPTYEDLETGISPNIQRHFDYLVPAVADLVSAEIPVTHFFLMADTEVDLLPFLKKLNISPSEFTRRSQESVDLIAQKVKNSYAGVGYTEIPAAARFLEYFGFDNWYNRYNYFLDRLMSEAQNDPQGRIARGLELDYRERKILIERLLGPVSKEDGIRHIARQKAQYMAFAALMREKFGKRLVVANHRTPNFAWMNDRITREPNDSIQLANGNYLDKLPLVELDISTLPKD